MTPLFHFLVILTSLQASNSRIINGKAADISKFKEVVRIPLSSGSCTGTLIGSRVLVTAAHCAPNGATVKFTVSGSEYSAKLMRSSLYPQADHNLALGLVDKEVEGVEFASIGGKTSVGLGVTLLGYGCTASGTPADGVLRYGETVIRDVQAYQVKSKADQGAVICFGDSGGPAYVFEGGRKLLIGVNSHGNQVDENNTTRTDIAASSQLFQNFATQNGVFICGVNKNCSAIAPSPTPTPPPVPAPKCTIAVNPQTLTLGNQITAKLTGSGDITEASIDGVSVSFPTGERTWKPGTAGSFKVKGLVKGSGGSGLCEASYTVTDPVVIPAPTCQLTASPNQILLGKSLKLVLTVTGTATAASIQGTSVPVSGGSIEITPATAGNHIALAKVENTSGANTCSTSYFVEGPQPNVPNYTVIPTHCGDNIVPESGVVSACIGIVKYSWKMRGLQVKDVVVVTHSDNSKEVLPVIYQEELGRIPETRRVKVEWGMYTNKVLETPQGFQFDMRKATLTKESDGTSIVPVSITGNTGKQGKFFNIQQLKKVEIP